MLMRNPKGSYIYPRCGYVLPKEDAVVSGWDSEGSRARAHMEKSSIIRHEIKAIHACMQGVNGKSFILHIY